MIFEWLFNHCRECDARIPWTERAYFGNKYMPVICRSCGDAKRAKIYGSIEAADAAYERAIVEELAR